MKHRQFNGRRCELGRARTCSHRQAYVAAELSNFFQKPNHGIAISTPLHGCAITTNKFVPLIEVARRRFRRERMRRHKTLDAMFQESSRRPVRRRRRRNPQLTPAPLLPEAAFLLMEAPLPARERLISRETKTASASCECRALGCASSGGFPVFMLSDANEGHSAS